MRQINRLRQLQQLAGARRDADVAVLERLKVQLRAVEMQIERLEQVAVEIPPDGADGPTAFQFSGRDALWDAWRQGRLRELSQKAAQARADIEQQTQKARKSVGKDQVLGKLVKAEEAVPADGY